MADQALIDRINGMTVRELRKLAGMTHGIKKFETLRQDALRAALIERLGADAPTVRTAAQTLGYIAGRDRSRPEPKSRAEKEAAYRRQNGGRPLTPRQLRRLGGC